MFTRFEKVKENLTCYRITVAVIMIATVIIGSGLTWAQVSLAEAGQGQMLLAQSADTYGLDTAAPPELKKTDNLGTQVGSIINIILGFVGVALLLLILYGGFTWMTAGGNEQKVETAKKIMSSAVVGFILVFLSYTITVFIARNFFSVQSADPGPQPTGACHYEIDGNPVCADDLTQADCSSMNGTWFVGDICVN